MENISIRDTNFYSGLFVYLRCPYFSFLPQFSSSSLSLEGHSLAHNRRPPDRRHNGESDTSRAPLD